jgi:phage repressor protein C with HTH and peptisase S24 domain
MLAGAVEHQLLMTSGDEPAGLPGLDGAGGEAEHPGGGAGAAELLDDACGRVEGVIGHERIIRTDIAQFKGQLCGTSGLAFCPILPHMDHMNVSKNPSPPRAGLKLKELRERAGLSVRRLAELLDVPFGTYSGWENESKRRFLTYDKAEKLMPFLVGVGDPPIMREEVLALCGLLEARYIRSRAVQAQPPLALPAPEGTPRDDRQYVRVREYDVGASAGHGAQPPELNGDGLTPVLAEWQLPADLIGAHVTPGSRLAVVRVEGDSMEPEYEAGGRVLVDLSRRQPSPPGVYVVWDGFGLVLKRLQVVAGSNPAKVRLSSINAAYDAYDVALAELHIAGRVIAKWTWR